MRLSKVTLIAVALCCCQSANACLNDSELPNHEREFRSQYLTSPLMTSATPARHSEPFWMMSSGGIALMAGAIGLTWFSRKNNHNREGKPAGGFVSVVRYRIRWMQR